MAWAALAEAAEGPSKIAGLTDIASGALRLALAPVRFVTDRVAMRFAGPLADLAPGQGAIVELDGARVAAFRDAEGAVQAVSPICTHLRCVVSFDEVSGEWHCPCHGSRFATDGSILKGPARRPLEPVRLEAGE